MLSRFGMGSVSMFVAIPRLVYAYYVTTFSSLVAEIFVPANNIQIANSGQYSLYIEREMLNRNYISRTKIDAAKCLILRHVVLTAATAYLAYIHSKELYKPKTSKIAYTVTLPSRKR